MEDADAVAAAAAHASALISGVIWYGADGEYRLLVGVVRGL